MQSNSQKARLKETYCLHCHLLTRADLKRCLQCGKPLESQVNATDSPSSAQVRAGLALGQDRGSTPH
jgi:hypothetical protein